MYVSPWFLVPMAVFAAIGLSRSLAYAAYRFSRVPVALALCECRVCGNHEIHAIRGDMDFEDLECMKCENQTCDLIDGEEVVEAFA